MTTPLRPTVVFPSIEALLVNYLTSHLPVGARADVPDPRPDEFMVVRRFGGPAAANEVSDEPLVVVEAWSTSGPTRAEALLQEARAWIKAASGGLVDDVPIYRVVEAAGPGNLPDPESRHFRYTYTVRIGLRGSSL